MRRHMIPVAIFLMMASACDGPGNGDRLTGPSFDLEGQIITLAATDASTAERSESPSKGRPRMGDGSPGSLAVTVSSASIASSSCKLQSDDVAMILYARDTKFEPTEVPSSRTFPINLRGRNIRAKGRLIGQVDDCLFLAETIELMPEGTGS